MPKTRDNRTGPESGKPRARVPGLAGGTRILALVLALAAGVPALAQDGGGPGGGMGGGPGENVAGGMGMGADHVGVSTLSDPPSAPMGTAPAAPMDAPTDAALADGPEPSAPAEPEDDGIIGLIPAPEGEPGLPADLLPPMQPVDLAGPGVAAFAEVQARRMLGPIDHPPVVVELFTSQGCSSCPPADEMLGDLADRDDVLALSWHVDYWDYLGWADEFARPEFTRRQQAYAHQSGERAIYTPQMIVGGSDTLIALRPAELMGLVQGQMARPPMVMVSSSQQEEGYRIELTPRGAIRDRVAIILVRYAPARMVTIKAGENRGVALNYRNVVLAAERVAEWDGRAPLRMTVKPDPQSGDAFPTDTRHAILAQELGSGDPRAASGPILAAIRLD
ncbi:DUF1223 domain-containing protein [Paracoccus sp. DMF]|uniref:DUF1223 domain-containing protein n=1 Tax=Paracoccus sp. DMF TaxID=400837 RepID=UPI0021E37C31|nr:DUF1223 domain-containing protein [Paracoccus sp. DMF]